MYLLVYLKIQFVKIFFVIYFKNICFILKTAFLYQEKPTCQRNEIFMTKIENFPSVNLTILLINY